MTGWMWLLGLGGCLPPLEDTGTSSETPMEFRAFSATCAGEVLSVHATVAGAPVGSALLDLWDSGAAYGWNEEHRFAVGQVVTETIPSTTGQLGDTGTPPAETRNVTELQMALTYTFSRDAVGDTAPGVGTTWFSCQPAGPVDIGVMTYAFRVYGLEGDLQGCIATGFDAPSIPAGVYAVTNGPPSNDAELAQCQVYPF